MLFQYEPELDAFLEFLIWRFSIWVDKPTPGNALMNLRYRDERAVESRGKGMQVRTYLVYGFFIIFMLVSLVVRWSHVFLLRTLN